MKSSSPAITDTPTLLAKRFILTQVSDKILAIPAILVAEILRVDKVKISSLPFYHDVVLGITHHNGSILPLLSTHWLLDQQPTTLREISTVVKLKLLADGADTIGLVVNQVLRSAIESELPEAVVLFHPQMLQKNWWQPLN